MMHNQQGMRHLLALCRHGTGIMVHCRASTYAAWTV
jgi:hypothetical protein